MSIEWQIGDRLNNRWQIHKILKGGMGIVYIVYDHDWRKAFAAKTFQDELFARSHPVGLSAIVQRCLAKRSCAA
jgi:hypothetical protein